MYLDFMTPAVWDVLVIVITLAGLALAGRQIAKNRGTHQRSSARKTPPHHENGGRQP